MRVAVIGAGPAGMVTVYFLERCGIENLEIICYERAASPGGEWIYTDRVGTDEYDLPVHGSMYKGMRTNITKKLMPLPDFSWPDEIQEYPFREEVLEHFCKFASHFSLEKHMKFRHYVHKISKADENSTKLIIDVEDLMSRSRKIETFDYVVMSTGKHSRGYVPHDTSKFTGQVMHYQDMKDPQLYKNKRVLIVGSSFASLDMVAHFVDISSALYLSYHTHPPFFSLPGLIIRPQIVELAANTVTFEDGSSCEVDIVLYATGYIQTTQLAPEISPKWGTRLSSFFPLFKHVVNPHCPSIMFVGFTVFGTLMFNPIQAAFVCAVIKGAVKLPSQEEMLADIVNFRVRWTQTMRNQTRPLLEFSPKLEMEFENANYCITMSKCKSISASMKRLYYEQLSIISSDVLNYRDFKLKVIPRPNSEDEFDFEWQKPETLDRNRSYSS